MSVSEFLVPLAPLFCRASLKCAFQFANALRRVYVLGSFFGREAAVDFVFASLVLLLPPALDDILTA